MFQDRLVERIEKGEELGLAEHGEEGVFHSYLQVRDSLVEIKRTKMMWMFLTSFTTGHGG